MSLSHDGLHTAGANTTNEMILGWDKWNEIGSGMDVVSIPVMVLVFFAGRYLLSKYVYQPIIDRNNLTQEKEVRKFHESAYKITFYLPIWILGMYIALSGGWMFDTKNCFSNMYSQDKPWTLTLFYGLELSWYIFCQITHVYFDVKRKDYVPMFIHHVVTIALICFSWSFGYFRVGLLVFLTMDICDTFLELSKLANYIKATNTSNTSFVMLVLTWIVFRLGFFPLYIVMPIALDVPEIHDTEGYPYSHVIWYVFVILLVILQCLQVFWFYLVIKALVKMLQNGAIEDPTDKQHTKKKKNE